MKQLPRKFRARKDVLGALLFLSIFTMGGVLLTWPGLIRWPMADKVGWLFVVLGVLAWWDWMITSYEFVHEDLVIRSGLSQQRVALCNIEEIHRRAQSLRIKCHSLRGTSWLTVMPRNEVAFMQRLWEKCPWLRTKK